MLLKDKIKLITSCVSIGMSVVGMQAIRTLTQEADEFAEQMKQLPKMREYPFVSVVVPARNEEECITACLTSILDQNYPNLEVIAVNDNSTDNTPVLLTKLLNAYSPSRFKVVEAIPPVNGWLGKNNALWQGYLNTSETAQWILFVDADTRLYQGTLEKAVNFAQTRNLDMLSLPPLSKFKGFWQRALATEIIKFYTLAANNLLRPPKPGSVEEASAVGPFILVRRAAYQATDGHKAIKNQVLEDVELARLFRSKGFATAQKPAFDYLEMTPYKNLSELWESVSKNIFLVAKKNWFNVAFVVLGEIIYGILPSGFLLQKLVLLSLKKQKQHRESRTVSALNIVSVALLVDIQIQINRTAKIPSWYGFTYPLAAVVTSVLMLDSAFRIGVRGFVGWKGREIKI